MEGDGRTKGREGDRKMEKVIRVMGGEGGTKRKEGEKEGTNKME
jgi:hypothetical protein